MDTLMKRRIGAALAALALTAGGLGVAGCGLFYLGLAAMVFRVDQWPLIANWLGL